jgi:hypothetical protein
MMMSSAAIVNICNEPQTLPVHAFAVLFRR